ncbi:AAA family ATPase [Comamonas aquatica]|uniref:AAA family ATPase n=1 Tax=Comamonas aquatica TaxID=225991 RepID=UPI00244C40E0|nr:AAA family ATPase [Comamonas aquatica]MDH1813007.1 AAA family ATPase [Comamonas aquatica]
MTEVVAQLHQCVASGSLDQEILDELKNGMVKLSECEVLDFKQQLPVGDFEYAKTVRDLVALHNSFGGFLVFGVKEVEKDRDFEIVSVEPGKLNLAKLRDMARSYLGKDLRIALQSISSANTYLEVIWVAKRSQGELPARFVKNGPEEKPKHLAFKKGDTVFRRLEGNGIAKEAEDFDFLFSVRRPPSLFLSIDDITKDEALDHNLPDRAFVCSRFVGRRIDIGDLWTWLADDFSRVRLIAGEGGLGKSSLAYRFAEEIATRGVKPFEQVIWLTAKARQFIAAVDMHRDTSRTDFHDAESLFRAIASAHGSIDSDFEGLNAREMMELALQNCATMPTFIVIDDVDSLSPPDQQRALEFGMRAPRSTKMLLTTRINFSYSPDNVLKLEGLRREEFAEYVEVLRSRYELPQLENSKVDHLHDVSNGSPLFTDSLLRLERRGLTISKAIQQWTGQQGMEARKAALKREVDYLSKPARRVLYVISLLKGCIYPELARIVDYAEQTLGDALVELSSLFLINMPTVAKQASYTVDPNTALLVMEIAPNLGIDHSSLMAKAKSSGSDAVGLTKQKRSQAVGLAIAQASALARSGDAKGALKVIQAAAKKLTNPHVDLLLANGRFSLKLNPPNRAEASQFFEQAYELGQRKLLMFDLWFEAEYGRSSFEGALDVAEKALESRVGEEWQWHERRAQVHIALAHRAGFRIASDRALREIDQAINELRKAKENSESTIQQKQTDLLIERAFALRKQIKG